MEEDKKAPEEETASETEDLSKEKAEELKKKCFEDDLNK